MCTRVHVIELFPIILHGPRWQESFLPLKSGLQIWVQCDRELFGMNLLLFTGLNYWLRTSAKCFSIRVLQFWHYQANRDSLIRVVCVITNIWEGFCCAFIDPPARNSQFLRGSYQFLWPLVLAALASSGGQQGQQCHHVLQLQ